MGLLLHDDGLVGDASGWLGRCDGSLVGAQLQWLGWWYFIANARRMGGIDDGSVLEWWVVLHERWLGGCFMMARSVDRSVLVFPFLR